MNNEKFKLMLKIAQENPNIDINDLASLANLIEESTPSENIQTIPQVHEVHKPIKRSRVRRKRWNTNDTNTLIYLYNKGYSSAEIAEQLDRTPQSVSSKISSLDEEKKYPNLNKMEPYSDEENNLFNDLIEKYGELKDIPFEELSDLAVLMGRSIKAIRARLDTIKKGRIIS